MADEKTEKTRAVDTAIIANRKAVWQRLHHEAGEQGGRGSHLGDLHRLHFL